MNSFLAVWLHPRQTIRTIVDQNPKSLVLLLAMAAGGGEIAMRGASVGQGMGTNALVVILVSGVVGALLGLAGLYFFGFLYRWVGGWFGGQATGVQVRAAIAWAKVPVFAVFVIWLIFYFVSKGAIADMSQTGPEFSVSLLITGVASIVLGVWSFILLCLMIGEVHKFSGWKGFLTVFLPGVIVLVPIFFIGLLAAIAIPNVLRARDNALQAQQVQQPAQVTPFTQGP